ncbi:MAG: hypothetical protein J6N76_03420 [Lachnospiraceae bacterium]|nr:hypothetical protein [Lachnospiraceae bacterium]
MMSKDITLLCQGCGREFVISQYEYDVQLSRDITMPVFCSNACAIHGWDPMAIWLGRARRANAENK